MFEDFCRDSWSCCLLVVAFVRWILHDFLGKPLAFDARFLGTYHGCKTVSIVMPHDMPWYVMCPYWPAEAPVPEHYLHHKLPWKIMKLNLRCVFPYGILYHESWSWSCSFGYSLSLESCVTWGNPEAPSPRPFQRGCCAPPCEMSTLDICNGVAGAWRFGRCHKQSVTWQLMFFLAKSNPPNTGSVCFCRCFFWDKICNCPNCIVLNGWFSLFGCPGFGGDYAEKLFQVMICERNWVPWTGGCWELQT